MRMRLGAMAVVVLLVPGCGEPAPREPVQHPRDATEVVRIDQGGWSEPPSWVLLGDGRLYTFRWEVMSDVAPALPNVVERQLTPAGVQAALDEVLKSGLFDRSADHGAIAEHVSRHHVTLRADGREVHVAVDNLSDFAAPQYDHLVPSGERQAFEAISRLLLRLERIDELLPPDGWARAEPRRYRPQALAVFVERSGADWLQDTPSWPLASSFATYDAPGGRPGLFCGVVTGNDAQLVLAALEGMSRSDSYWVDRDGELYSVAFRPFLPSEEATCGPE